MIRNYFLSAIRNMRRNLGFTVLNILGLSPGIAAALLNKMVNEDYMRTETFGRIAPSRSKASDRDAIMRGFIVIFRRFEYPSNPS